MIKAIVCDDHNEFRTTIIDMLKTDAGIDVVGEAEDGFVAVALAKRLLPDVVILDIKMPGMDGLSAAKRINDFCSETGNEIKMLILSAYHKDEHVLASIECGAYGYLRKEVDIDELVGAVKNVSKGIKVFDEKVHEIRDKLIQSVLLDKLVSEDERQRFKQSGLTCRELDVFKLIAAGNANAQIAKTLCLSEGTVKNCVSKAMSKLNCSNSRELAGLGAKLGVGKL